MNAEPLPLRDAQPDDLPAIVAIYNATVASRQVTADLAPVSVESRRAWFNEHSPERRPIWVVEQQSRIVAWLSYSSFHTRPAYDATCEVSIYVDAAERRKGWGDRLLERCIQYSPTIGVTRLIGLIFAHNEPSLRLFEKHGFARWGHLPGVCVLDGIERDVVIVGRRTDVSS